MGTFTLCLQAIILLVLESLLPVTSAAGWTETKLACIHGSNERELKTNTFEECKTECEQTTSFICRSADYRPSTKVCQLSPADSSNPYYDEPCKHWHDNIYAERMIGTPCDGVRFGTKCLTLIQNDPQSWNGAKLACAAKGLAIANMESFDTYSFQAYVLDKYSSGKIGVQQFWAGGNDINVEGSWYWSNRLPVADNFLWRKTGTPEPNGGRRENCLALWNEPNGAFIDYICDYTRNYICEKAD